MSVHRRPVCELGLQVRNDFVAFCERKQQAEQVLDQERKVRPVHFYNVERRNWMGKGLGGIRVFLYDSGPYAAR